MNLAELRSRLQAHSELLVALILPDGRRVPDHYHVTEVGHVARKFVDCGGTFRASESCVLQTWIGRDADHRLKAGRLAHILGLARPILPPHDVPVEIEYEDDVVSQFPLDGTSVEAGELRLQLGLKHTACLAREKCGRNGTGDETAEPAGCCTGPATASCC